ncbi:MAG: FAD:protein FMN transferase [Candidatus Omnitrophica bacterium]|nr:FAD:protein FMN transferase [Candidatus Omnitrophota bacterium]
MRPLKNILFLLILIPFLISISACSKNPYYKRNEFALGTVIQITCSDQRAIDIAFNEIKRVENLLSKYVSDSEVSKLNTSGKLKVGPDLLYVLTKAKEFYITSNGAFDVTVGPLVDIWKKAIKNKVLPQEEDIKKAMQLVGFDKVVIDEKESTVAFLKEGMSIDLGAIGKGYAVDCAIKKVRDNGTKSCLIAIAGDIYCLGNKNGEPWQIGIQHPRNKKDLLDALNLENQAVSTSGDYQQMVIIGNKRYSHIIDPRTGFPSDSKVISATVLAPDCLSADALATTIFVLGKTKGMDLVKYYKNTKALIYTEDEVNAFDTF